MIKKVFKFYYQGFINMSKQSKKLWLIIFIKLFIMFAILKVFFFPDILKTKYKTDKDRIEHIENQILKDYG
ncbi:MAG TPA: DUF4492 domain-containing protein [Bacteroidetes bacterium]|nr:DUF4492 domain-containing protein [Bacteroidota bacterium]